MNSGFLFYQLALITPGISPRRLKLRKQIRHISNLLKYPRALPQRGQRWYFLTLNLGSCFAFIIKDFLANVVSLSL
jgi:hypothetical protein